MDNIIFLAISIVIILFIILCTRIYKEKWYPTTTYVNTPNNYGIYPNGVNGLSGYNMYNPLRFNNPYFVNNWSNMPASAVGLADIPNSGAGIPLGNPIPSNTIRMMGPMLTSIKSPKDYAIGQWVYAGTAYTDNPNDFTYGTIYQLNLDPGRELFRYSIKIKDIGTIPINLPPNHNRLEDGDRFKVQGMEGKGDFVFSEADKYRYVYV